MNLNHKLGPSQLTHLRLPNFTVRGLEGLLGSRSQLTALAALSFLSFGELRFL